MAAILVSQNNETAAMLVSQTSPLGVELVSYANAFFCSNKFAYACQVSEKHSIVCSVRLNIPHGTLNFAMKGFPVSVMEVVY